MFNLVDLMRKLARGTRKSRDLVEQCLDRIEQPQGQGKLAFVSLYPDEARAAADQVDEARRLGRTLPPCAGIPLAIKDLFDLSGEVTRAGSRVLDDDPPAIADAPAVTRLKQAGFIVLGKNNMSEFAYSGIGLNPQRGTPASPFDRESGYIPGGSSSGAGVAVSDGMVPLAIGTDTGGSCRIPAAFCGVVGFKPTTARVPREGMVPLSHTLDCIGPLANTVSCCAVADGALSGTGPVDVESFPEAGLRVGVLGGNVMAAVDESVGQAYEQALIRLSRRGVRLAPVEMPELDELTELHQRGTIAGAEGFSWHEPLIATRGDRYQPWIRSHIVDGGRMSAAAYLQLLAAREGFIERFRARTITFDCLILPTVQIAPPRFSDLNDDAAASRIDSLCLWNTTLANFLDWPAISLPCHSPGQPPAGAMLMSRRGEDRRLLSIARGVEYTVKGD